MRSTIYVDSRTSLVTFYYKYLLDFVALEMLLSLSQTLLTKELSKDGLCKFQVINEIRASDINEKLLPISHLCPVKPGLHSHFLMSHLPPFLQAYLQPILVSDGKIFQASNNCLLLTDLSLTNFTNNVCLHETDGK